MVLLVSVIVLVVISVIVCCYCFCPCYGSCCCCRRSCCFCFCLCPRYVVAVVVSVFVVVIVLPAGVSCEIISTASLVPPLSLCIGNSLSVLSSVFAYAQTRNSFCRPFKDQKNQSDVLRHSPHLGSLKRFQRASLHYISTPSINGFSRFPCALQSTFHWYEAVWGSASESY